MKKLCYVTTIPATVHAFLRGYIEAAMEKYEVTIVCNLVDAHLLDDLNARLLILPIERKPSPWRDLLVLFQLFKILRRGQFDIVHSIMPKTGIIAMLASFLARVPNRIHTFTGQVWATKSGVRRILLKWFDKMIACFATCILADSPSQRDFLIHEDILSPAKITVIGAGSICGVDSTRFRPNQSLRSSIRHELKLALDTKIILYVGRLNRDKGILDLASAYSAMTDLHKDVALVVVGTEENVSLNRIQEICGKKDSRFRHVPFTSTPEKYMAAADIFCMPSYREGFGMTIIEAAACAIPAVASRIYGITDAVADGETGVLVPAGDVSALGRALSKLLMANDLRLQMGSAARVRALEFFSSDYITHETVKLYDRLTEKSHNE